MGVSVLKIERMLGVMELGIEELIRVWVSRIERILGVVVLGI